MHTMEFVSPQHQYWKGTSFTQTLPSESFLLVVNSTGLFIRQVFLTIRQTGNLVLPTIKIITQIASCYYSSQISIVSVGFST